MIPGTWTEPAFAALAELLGARTGLAFAPSRSDYTEVGIRRAMERARVADAGRYLELLEAGELTLDDLIAELTVGETYFFREPAQFELIRREVLPDVLQRRPLGHAIRVWSAGCASGEEAYSLAIVVEEAGLADRTQILGTDIARAGLARARDASYGAWSLRGVDQAVVRRYFRQKHDRQVLHERIATRVSFELLNLALDPYPSHANGAWGIDLILCRNVLIYFDRTAIARVARGFHATLADGGWLVTGPSDPPLGDLAPFESVVTPAGVFYRRSNAFGAAHPPAHDLRPVASPAGIPFAAPEEPSFGASLAPPRSLVEPPTPPSPEPAGAEALRLRALANRAGSEQAEKEAAVAVERHPLSVELHFLRAVLLVDLGRDHDAERAVKRAIYLDRTLAVGHFLLGSVLRRLGNLEGARRAFQNARDLAGARPADEPLALGDGEPAARLAEAATAELASISVRTEAIE